MIIFKKQENINLCIKFIDSPIHATRGTILQYPRSMQRFIQSQQKKQKEKEKKRELIL